MLNQLLCDYRCHSHGDGFLCNQQVNLFNKGKRRSSFITNSYPVTAYLFLFALEYGKAMNARKGFWEGGRKSDDVSQISSVLPLIYRELIKSYPQAIARTRGATGYESGFIKKLRSVLPRPWIMQRNLDLSTELLNRPITTASLETNPLISFMTRSSDSSQNR